MRALRMATQKSAWGLHPTFRIMLSAESYFSVP